MLPHPCRSFLILTLLSFGYHRRVLADTRVVDDSSIPTSAPSTAPSSEPAQAHATGVSPTPVNVLIAAVIVAVVSILIGLGCWYSRKRKLAAATPHVFSTDRLTQRTPHPPDADRDDTSSFGESLRPPSSATLLSLSRLLIAHSRPGSSAATDITDAYSYSYYSDWQPQAQTRIADPRSVDGGVRLAGGPMGLPGGGEGAPSISEKQSVKSRSPPEYYARAV